MDKKSLHIIAFDNPQPPDYGGAIDVFYKIKSLAAQQVDIILHIWQYNDRRNVDELEKYCKEIHFYPRNMKWHKHLSVRPFIVHSRRSKQLENNLLKDDFPVLVEGMHGLDILRNPSLRKKNILFRAHNIEHHYYAHLFRNASSLPAKIFFWVESMRLSFFERKLHNVNSILSVSHKDYLYHKKHFAEKINVYLPSFHANSKLVSAPGRGEYILFHGNLGVAENEKSVFFLVEKVFSRISYPVVIAGKNPSRALIRLLAKYSHIRLEDTPSMGKMSALIANAHIIVLHTFQATGLKLKLLHSLFQGRFIIANPAMLAGTGLEEAVVTASGEPEMIKEIERLMLLDFTEEMIAKRRQILQQDYSNERNVQKILSLL